MEAKGLRVNMKKTKFMMSGAGMDVLRVKRYTDITILPILWSISYRTDTAIAVSVRNDTEVIRNHSISIRKLQNTLQKMKIHRHLVPVSRSK